MSDSMDSMTVKGLVEKMDVDGIGALIALFMYQGFSPEMVFQHLAKVVSEGSITNAEFQSDMKALIIIGVVMGNYNSNNSQKISDEGKVKGDALMTKYKLKMGGVGKEKKAVNIPRILAAFPIITSKVALSCPARNYGGAFNADLLSPSMKTPVFPALVPRSSSPSTKIILAASNAYAAEQTMAISGQTNANNAYMGQVKFTTISNESPVPNSRERSSYIKKLEISYSGIEAVIKMVNEVTKKGLAVPAKDEMVKEGFNMV
jgi:hypothetical protein